MKKNRKKSFFIILYCFLVILSFCADSTGLTKKNVLVLHSYHKGLGWTDNITKGIESVFKKSFYKIDICYEYMDTKRIFDKTYLSQLAQLYRYKYHHRKFDAIISSDDHAFHFLLDHRDDLFGDTPVVFCGVNYFTDSMLYGHSSITGVVESFSIAGTIDVALKINADTRKIYVLVDNTVTGRANKKLLSSLIPKYKGRLEFNFIENVDMSQAQALVQQLPEKSILIWLAFTADASGKIFSLEESADLISKFSNRPMYSFWDFHLGHGIVGGMLTSGFAHGETAAKMALHIFNGESITRIPVIKKSPNRYIFDYNIMQKFGIKLGQLPEKSLIINKPVSFYSQHKVLFWDLVGAIVFLLLIISGFIINLFKRTKAEGALRKSEEKYRSILESIEEGYYEVNIAGDFTFFNDTMCRMLQYSPDELMGMNNRKYMDEDNAKKVYQTFNRVYRTGESVKVLDWELIKKDGSKCFMDVGVSLIKNDRGQPAGFRGIARDITERKIAEAEKKKLQTQLYHAERMESLGTLAGGIAHDFNNLMMGIQGRISLILMDIDPSHPHYEHVKSMEDYIKSLVNLTHQLLGFARGGKYEIKVTDLNTLLKKQIHMFGRTQKEINCHEKYEKNLWAVEVDQGQIEQMMLNFYVNALQAMPAGGDLYVQTQNMIIDENGGKLHPLKPGKYVKISVTDTGIGMDKNTQKRIFDPFFTTKSMGGGSGLGLASAYGIINNHGGIITVYSEKGVGSTFEVFLPASEKKVVLPRKSPLNILEGSETILLVDDEEMILNVGKLMLEKLGYTVITAKGGEAGIEIYLQNRHKIDAIILDMIMPDLSGSKTFDRLRRIAPEIKILLSSGYSCDGQAEKIINRGCNGFIQKPFNLHRLAQKIRDILDAG